jgi:glycosyltransferase involved in cell wall biosynthesis
MSLISIVVPTFREEGNIQPFLERVIPILQRQSPNFEVIFAMDPSRDRTREMIIQAHEKDPRIKCIEFSRRFGQPMATLAGLQYSTGDVVVVMDVDLQDPPELLPEMIAKWQEGFDVVYAQRKSHKGQNLIYRLTSILGYKLIRTMAQGLEIPENTGDFRLMSRRVVDEVLKLRETHGFLRGMVALVGYRQTSVLFERPPRHSGRSNYNRFFGSLKIGVNGLICFSTYPLTLTMFFGFTVAALSFLLAFVYGIMKLRGVPFPLGNPTIVILVLLLSGVQLISVGILGEYIGRIYDEVKRRPRFIIDRAIGFNK